MTFSVSARCPRTGMLGMAVASSSPAVAARCAHARAGVGVVASQNITDPALGRRGLALMEVGLDAQRALQALIASTKHIEYRQLALIDARGGVATYSGSRTLGRFATAEGDGVACCGNLLANAHVARDMRAGFERSGGALGTRLLDAMRAGLEAGGEAGPIHSAGLLLVHEVSWPVVDLRVDWDDDDPLARLESLWSMYSPQFEDYVTRALDPARAPSFGVPGDA